MKLSDFEVNNLFDTINNMILSKKIFSNYVIFEHKKNEVHSPENATQYDSIYISENNNRWLFIRIELFLKKIRITIYVNKLLTKDVANLNIENYFIENHKDKNISKKMSINNVNSLEDLKIKLNELFDYINEHSDEKLKEILKGSFWEKQSFDWNGYK